MILGPPRSGKTSSLVVPNVLAANGPVVVHIDQTRRARCHGDGAVPVSVAATCSTRPVLSNEAENWLHLRWSPLQSCGSWPGALSMARSLVVVGMAGPGHGLHQGGGSHWTERAQALLAPLLHAAALEGADMRTVLTWVDRHQALPAQQILADRPGRRTELARNLLDGIALTEARELSGIWSTASGALRGFRSDETLETTTDPTFDPARFVESSDTVYIAAPAHQQAAVAPLVVGLLEDIRRAAYARHASLGDGSDPPPPLLLALDEVANIAPLPDLPAMVSEGGGQGVITLACFQDLSQARQRWPGSADGFTSLFGTTAVLPGIGDVATLEALSTLAGDEELAVRTTSVGHAPSDRPFTDLLTGGRPHLGASVSTQWRRRLPPDVITRGSPGHLLAFDDRNQPSWVSLAPSYRTEPWRSLRGTGRERIVRRDTDRDREHGTRSRGDSVPAVER